MAPSTKDHPRKRYRTTTEIRQDVAAEAMFERIAEHYEAGKREIHAG